MSVLIPEMPLQEWAKENEPSKEMFFYKGYWDQIMFIRDNIASLLFSHLHYRQARENIKVVSTHISKSITLPVFQIKLPEHDTTLILRNNFYDWKVSVNIEDPFKKINNPFEGLIDAEKAFTHIYCEGFDPSWVYLSYAENKKKFTVEIGDNYNLYTFLYLLKQELEK